MIARRIINAVIKEYGAEVFLGDGYAPDADLFDGIMQALEQERMEYGGELTDAGRRQMDEARREP